MALIGICLSVLDTDESSDNPSEAYLRGALWMGRNFGLIFEEVAESLDLFRTKFMTEVWIIDRLLFFIMDITVVLTLM